MKNSKIKIILFVIGLLTSTLIFSQIDKSKLRKYYLINKFNDTIPAYGKILSIERLQAGFRVFDKNGNRTKHKVNPNTYKYLLFTNSDKKSIILKSLPIKRNFAFLDKKATNVFMNILIENSEEEIEKGKVDLYMHKFTAAGSQGANGFSGYSSGNVQTYYFKNLSGLHQITYKYQFKSFPKILGNELYKKMEKSDKGQKQFLFDYFTEYNNSVVKLNPK